MTEAFLLFGERVPFLGAGIPGMPGSPGAPADGGGNGGGTDGGGTYAGTGTTTGTTTGGDTPQGPGSCLDMGPMLLIWAAVFAGMWFLMIRPQRKREKKMREMQAAITVGDNVVTNGGLFGKVADVGEDCFIVEFGTNRGVRVPILKADVVAIRTPKMTPQPIESTTNIESKDSK